MTTKEPARTREPIDVVGRLVHPPVLVLPMPRFRTSRDDSDNWVVPIGICGPPTLGALFCLLVELGLPGWWALGAMVLMFVVAFAVWAVLVVRSARIVRRFREGHR